MDITKPKVVSVCGVEPRQVRSVVDRLEKEMKYTVIQETHYSKLHKAIHKLGDEGNRSNLVISHGPLDLMYQYFKECLECRHRVNMLVLKDISEIQKKHVTHQIIIPYNLDHSYLVEEFLIQGALAMIDDSPKTVVLNNQSKEDNWRMIVDLLTDIQITNDFGTIRADSLIQGLNQLGDMIRKGQ